MKLYILIFLLLTVKVYSIEIYNKTSINYTDPVNGATLVKPENNITFGFNRSVNLSEIEIVNSLIVKGELSGIHNGTVKIIDEGKKFIFKPDLHFFYGEKVTVEFTGMLRKFNTFGSRIFNYTFHTSSENIAFDPVKNIEKETGINFNEGQLLFAPPVLNVTINNNPAPGMLFCAPLGGVPHITILNNNGSTFWYQQRGSIAYDFKPQPNGHLTFYANLPPRYVEFDGNYNLVHTYSCGNGYTTDMHELQLLPNGNAFLMAYDPEIVDMSQIVPGGNPNATVIGLIIQEIDQQNNVLFQWRSWDHMLITDATHENLTDSVIDYIHGNAIELDYDNNILISSRHIDEITKINHTTGDIIWRFGGKNNMFTIINDSIRFSHQHDIRRLANGHVTFFDNGSFRFPEYSRAVEYSLDETNHTATLVWQYQRNPQAVSTWGGNVQRLPNGNTFIAWGGCVNTFTEVQPNETVVFEASYNPGIFTYRGFKYSWPLMPTSTGQELTSSSSFKLGPNYPNPFNPDTKIKFSLDKSSNTSIIIYDIKGSEIMKCFSGFLNSGEHEITFDGSSLSSGVYFYRLVSGNNSETRKMMLIK